MAHLDNPFKNDNKIKTYFRHTIIVLLSMKFFSSLLVLIFVFAASTITIASDTLERIIENKVSTGLTNIGNKIAEIIPGDGDTEVTISEQDN